MGSPYPDYQLNVGARIREARHLLDMTQEELAEAAGLHWTYVGQVERGQRNLTITSLLRIAGGLRLDPGKLVEGLAI